MLNKKSAVALLLAGAMVFTMVGCGNKDNKATTAAPASEGASGEAATGEATTGAASNAGEKKGATVLKYAFNQTLENPEAQAVLALSDKLYDETDGRYSIEVYPSEQLGSQAESLELIQAGTVEMGMVSNSIIEAVCPDFAITGAPYVYESDAHQKKLFESDALDEFFAMTKDQGFEIIGVYSLGARNVYSTFPVKTPADLSGKKIRVMQSDTMIKMMEALGGIGTPMAQGEVYTAIQAGTLDGAENNIITYTDLVQYEVAPEYSLTNHLMIPDMMVISNTVLDSMGDDADVLRRLAKESVTDAFERCESLRDGYFEKATKELGVTVTEVDIKPFQEACMELISEIADRNDNTKAAYSAITDAAK